MGVPAFLLRKLYKRGSLRQIGANEYAFTIQNVLADATLVGPPRIVVNGIEVPADQIRAPIHFAKLDPRHPHVLAKGDSVDLRCPGRLMRQNRIHIVVPTEEFGQIDFLVEDHEAEFCDVPGEEE